MDLAKKVSWLASYPKSGNTWVRLFLASYRNGGYPVYPNAIPADLCASDAAIEDYAPFSPISVDQIENFDCLQLRGAMLLGWLARTPIRPLIMKSHNARVNVDNVELIPPKYTGPSVYVVRDPRDVAVSFSRWLVKDIDYTIEAMEAENHTLSGEERFGVFSWLGNWSAHVESWGDKSDTIVVRYEDMLSVPVEVFSAILQHLGIGLDVERVERAIANTAFSKLQDMEARGRFVETTQNIERFFRKGEAGQWKTELTKDQVDRIIAAHGTVMEKLGYDTDVSAISAA